MSEEGKDRVFLAYANYSLRVDPKNFFKICDVGDRCLSSLLIDKKRLRAQVEAVVEFALSKKPDVRLIHTDMHLMTSVEAVHGYRDGFCEYHCRVRSLREERWGREPFEEPDRWNCIECDQRDFVLILMDIMKGTPLSKTEEYFPYQPRDTVSSGEEGFKRLFREYWSSLIYSSLSEFLEERDENWRRLKLCPYCYEFFTATKLDKKICYSQNCRKAYNREQKKHYMRRKRDPDSSEYAEEYKTREFPKKKPS